MREDRAAQGIDQGLQLHPAHADPLAQGRARDRVAGPAEDLFLAVQGKVVGVLGHHHLGEQPGGGNPLVDHLRGHRRLDQGLALGAGPLAADVALNGEDAGLVGELLGNVLADALHLAAAGAGGRFRFVLDDDTRQVLGQNLAPRLALLPAAGCFGWSCSSSSSIAPGPRPGSLPAGLPACGRASRWCGQTAAACSVPARR